jgi:hypothetical protein
MGAFSWSQPNCDHCGQPKPTAHKPPPILDQAALAEPVDRLKQVVIQPTKYTEGE